MEVTITKLVHACLLVATNETRVLIDPGTFSWQDERLELATVEGVDRILITHEHADHVSVEFLRAVLERSDNAPVETTPALQTILAEHGIKAVVDGTPQFAAPHERIPIGPGPQNVGFHVAGAVTHPGDSHSFVETMPILAMPFAAPWGSLTNGADRARLVRPRYVVPIHDWFLSEPGRTFMYQLAKMALDEDGIELVQIEDFESVTLEV